MSDPSAASPRKLNTSVIKSRFRQLRVTRQGGIVGPAEIIALAGSFFILFLVLIGYFYFQMPARARLQRLGLERSRLQSQLRNSQTVVHQGQTTENAVQSIAQSLDDFENNTLVGPGKGRMSLYDTLNDLMRKNALRNTSGPTYIPLDAAGTKTASGGTKANAKWQSIFPGVAVSVTVEGQYQNLRRFVRDIEATKQFVIINAVELERSTQSNQPAPVEGEAGEAPQSSTVSLRLDMATYFQRTSEGTGDNAH